MSKEDKPLEYQRRIRDTKGVAQRLDLGYLGRESWLVLLRKRATWAMVAAAALACVPLVLGVGPGRKAVESGPLADAHAILEKRCEACHGQAFGGVTDKACQECHDGAAHPAKSMDAAHATTPVHCAECHVEHRGRVKLADVGDASCTRCHTDLAAHATGVKLQGTKITGFMTGKHPEFSAGADERPVRLNHAIHMPAQAKVIRGMKLPMKCVDCHVPDKVGGILPVTFEANCKSCHARELEFDVYHVGVPPAPHLKDVNATLAFIAHSYEDVLAKNPAMWRRPLGNDLMPVRSSEAWLNRVIGDSREYLFGRKCRYCHENALRVTDGARVGLIAGHWTARGPEPWLPRAEFNHRAHRAVTCESCHTQARTSTKTSDVLIAKMQSCTPCHGRSGTRLDNCTTCHLYHNRDREQDRARPLNELVGQASRPAQGLQTLPAAGEAARPGGRAQTWTSAPQHKGSL